MSGIEENERMILWEDFEAEVVVFMVREKVISLEEE